MFLCNLGMHTTLAFVTLCKLESGGLQGDSWKEHILVTPATASEQEVTAHFLVFCCGVVVVPPAAGVGGFGRRTRARALQSIGWPGISPFARSVSFFLSSFLSALQDLLLISFPRPTAAWATYTGNHITVLFFGAPCRYLTTNGNDKMGNQV